MASATRSTEPPLLVSVGETSVETFIEIQSLVKQLSAARVAEDVTGIKKVIESIEASTNLTEKQREQLIQLATQAKTGIAPQEGIDEDSTLDALNKLAGPSRGAQDYYYNILYKNGSRKTRSFKTYRAALESRISDNIMNNVSDIVGPPTLFSFPPDTTIRGSLPPGHFLVKDKNNAFIVDQRDAKPANLVGNGGASLAAASTDAKAVEQVKTMVANGMVAAGGGNLAAGRGLMSQNGVVKLIYKKR